MDVALTLGKMGESMKVSTSLIKNMVSVLTLGRTEESMLESGRTAKGMEEARSFQWTAAREKGSGRMM